MKPKWKTVPLIRWTRNILAREKIGTRNFHREISKCLPEKDVLRIMELKKQNPSQVENEIQHIFIKGALLLMRKKVSEAYLKKIVSKFTEIRYRLRSRSLIEGDLKDPARERLATELLELTNGHIEFDSLIDYYDMIITEYGRKARKLKSNQ